jgi:hypothetical protein
MNERLRASGLNVQGVADGSKYAAWLPGCRSVLVFASGGSGLWEALLAACRTDPQRWSGEDHPLDAFVRDEVRAADPDPPPSRRWVFCGALEEKQPDFRTLAWEAGLGHPSKLGLLLHPVYGPWLGLRAACFTTDSVAPTGPLPGPAPCDGCPAPCVTACLGNAMSSERGWDVRACASFHETSRACHRDCASRVACPVGEAHRYGELERLYHNNRVVGRPAVAAFLGIEADDRRQGAGPHWALWKG